MQPQSSQRADYIATGAPGLETVNEDLDQLLRNLRLLKILEGLLRGMPANRA